MKKIFIAATQQNDGKTTISLGLMFAFKKRFKHIGFIKPIGQRYLEEEGVKVDEDSVLIEKVFGLEERLKDMNPVAVERGFTENYILSPQKENITRQIKDSFNRISKDCKMTIIEGTGHAGVGSVFDHSNAYVAKLLGAKVILVSSGGIGRPIDEILLNKALFDKNGVKLLGVVINKVLPEKYDKINKFVRKGLGYKKVEVLGVIPYRKELSYPNARQIAEETNFKLLCGENYLDNKFSSVTVGAMYPKDAISYLKNDSLLVTGADRRDIIMLALNSHRRNNHKKLKINALVLSGVKAIPQSLLKVLEKMSIPVFLSCFDTYTTVCIINNINVKIKPQDEEKINLVKDLIRRYLDIGKIIERIKDGSN